MCKAYFYRLSPLTQTRYPACSRLITDKTHLWKSRKVHSGIIDRVSIKVSKTWVTGEQTTRKSFLFYNLWASHTKCAWASKPDYSCAYYQLHDRIGGKQQGDQNPYAKASNSDSSERERAGSIDPTGQAVLKRTTRGVESTHHLSSGARLFQCSDCARLRHQRRYGALVEKRSVHCVRQSYDGQAHQMDMDRVSWMESDKKERG